MGVVDATKGFFGWLFGRKSVCPNCGEIVGAGFKFCPSCREPSLVKRLVCSNSRCRRSVKSDSKFCPFCREPIRQDLVEREAVAIVWKKKPDQLARRFDIEDIQEATRAGFIVEVGTRALMFADGALVGALEPGRYTEFFGRADQRPNEVVNNQDELVKRLVGRRQVVAVIMHDGDIEREFQFPRLTTKDNLEVPVKVTVVVRLADPLNFYLNVMGPSGELGAYTFPQLQARLFDELKDAFTEHVRRHAIDELATTERVKADMETGVQAHMNKTLQRFGLELVQVRVFVADSAEMERIRRGLGAAEIRKREGQVVEAAGMAEAEVKRREAAVALARVQAFEQLQQALNSEQVAKAQAALELEATLGRLAANMAGQGRMTREEAAELAAAAGEGRGDRKTMLALYQSKLEVLHRTELEKHKLLLAADLALAQVETRTKLMRAELESQAALKRQGLLTELETQLVSDKKKGELELARLDVEIEKSAKSGRAEVELARLRAERADIEREVTRKNMDLALVMQGRQAELGRQQQWEAVKMKLALDDAAARRKVEELGALKGMTDEQAALYLASDPNRAAVLMARAREAAAAAASERERAQQKEHVERLERMMAQAMAGMKEVATAGAAGRATMAEAKNLVGIGVEAAKGAAGGKWTCRKCGLENEPKFNFCANCGTELG